MSYGSGYDDTKYPGGSGYPGSAGYSADDGAGYGSAYSGGDYAAADYAPADYAPADYGQGDYAGGAYGASPYAGDYAGNGAVQPAYAAGQPVYYGAPAPRTNTLAIVALVLSLVGLSTGITAIGGIICGHIARKQIRETGENGDGLALAALIVGYIIGGFWLAIILLYIAVFVFIGLGSMS